MRNITKFVVFKEDEALYDEQYLSQYYSISGLKKDIGSYSCIRNVPRAYRM